MFDLTTNVVAQLSHHAFENRMFFAIHTSLTFVEVLRYQRTHTTDTGSAK
jgi:hypothetical protein